MMMDVNVLINVCTKVATACGKDDLINITFQVAKGVNVMSVLAYDCKGLQIQQLVPYEGEPEKEGNYILKATTFIAALKQYQALGVKSISLIPDEKELTLKDENGETSFPLCPAMKILTPEEIKQEKIGKVVVSTKGLNDALHAVSGAVGGEAVATKLYGIYFLAEEKGFRLFTTDGFKGISTLLNADFKPCEGKEIKDMSFLAMPMTLKLAGILKGDAVEIAVGAKYIILRDSERTMFVVALSGEKYPIDSIKAFFNGKDEVGSINENDAATSFCYLTVGKEQLLALTGLARVMATSSDSKVKFVFVREGESGKVSITEPNGKTLREIPGATVEFAKKEDIPESMTFSTRFFETILNTANDEKVTIRFSSVRSNIFDGGADSSYAFILRCKEESESKK